MALLLKWVGTALGGADRIIGFIFGGNPAAKGSVNSRKRRQPDATSWACGTNPQRAGFERP